MEDEIQSSTGFRVGCVLVLALGVWFRITSLDAIPNHNGDESYEGIQVAKMLQGQPFTVYTMNANLLDPFFLALQAPFHYLGQPSVWILRMPAVVSGLLAVVATIGLGGRALDRRTGLIAGLLLAVLPTAILYSRIAHEYSQLPLVGAVALSFAFRGRPIALLLTIGVGLLVHPISIFLVPVALPVALVQLVRSRMDEPERLRRQLVWLSLAALAVIVPVVAVLLSRPFVRAQIALHEPLDWEVFLTGIERFLLHEYPPVSNRASLLQTWIFWGIVGVVSSCGVSGLVRDRRWDRLALVLGFVAQLAAFHLLAGPKKLFDQPSNRYGVVFLVPTAWTLAVLIEATFSGWAIRRPAWSGSGNWSLRFGREVFVLATAAALLIVVNTNVFATMTELSKESIWTLRSERPDHFEAILSTILEDAGANADAGKEISANPAEANHPLPCVILAETYWTQKPLEYLVSWRSDVKIELLDPHSAAADPKTLAEALQRGSYVVTFHTDLQATGMSQIAPRLSQAFRPGELRRWDFESPRRTKILSVYRLETSIARNPPPTVVR